MGQELVTLKLSQKKSILVSCESFCLPRMAYLFKKRGITQDLEDKSPTLHQIY